ncbi:MAG: type II toxin-antitoxin system MqsR family toxin [Gammaproteobacteria bacterium]|jgi:hypothetical protein|nr:type II toxin-antitoxin system MqsR family toxin [Gammaproteobacteria bacterium]
MVSSNNNEDKRDTPEYSLDQIRLLAGFRQIEYRGRGVGIDIASLGYNMEDVCQCLIALQKHHFAHSIWYSNFPRWHDVYKLQYSGNDGVNHDLYIKLRLSKDCVLIELCSFHP